MVQNHNISIPWTQNNGSTQLTRRHGPKHRFKFQDLTAMDQKNDHQHIRAFVKYNPRVYTPLSRWTCVYDFFYFLSAWTDICLPKKVAIKDNTCAIAPNLCHNANSQVRTWWKHQDHSPPLSSRAKGCAPPEYMLKFSVLTMLPLTVGKTCKKMFLKKNRDLDNNTRPSYHHKT